MRPSPEHPAVSSHATLPQLLVAWERCVDWGKLGEALPMALQGTPHPCWIETFQGQPFRGRVPTLLWVTPHL